MKKYLPALLIIAILALEFAPASAQSGKKERSSISLINDDGINTTIQFTTGPMQQRTVNTPQGEELVISIDKGTPILRAGYPDLPKLDASVIVPDDKEMEVTVTASHYTDYTGINVAPSKGTLSRTIDPSTVPFTYAADVYDDDVFYPKTIAELRDPYILRDYRGQTVVAYPFQYNAATKTLRVYSDITVKVSPKDAGTPVNPFLRKKPIDKIQTEFANVYQKQFLNYTSASSRYTPLDDHGNMLIICDGSFLEAMQPFVDWKIQEGIKTEIVDVATVGNDATSIKNYVADYYNTKGLTFLLLAGDHAQVSTGSVPGSGDSDNQYGYITGSDHYQEIFVGRFSATTVTDVTTQVNRTIEYEKNPAIDGYYSKGVAIASNYGAGQGDDGEADYDHERNIRNQLLGYTYTDIQELYDSDHPGGNDANGDPNDADLAALVNAGTGIVNYTGHGDVTLIVTTGFNNSDVDALTNTHAWPFIWIVGCQTGNFKNNTCFGEEWARHTYNGLPSGSIANFMSTINQYWAEPMEMQDEGNNILAEAETNNIRRTFGGLSINGCFSMNDAYGQSGYDMTDTWTLFGDPSVMVRTAQPTSMVVSHDPQILLGVSQFVVNCDFDDAVVSITHGDELLGTGTVSSGSVNVEFQAALANVDSVLITVTAFNKIPYITKIPALLANGPYIINADAEVNDAGGNNNGLADYGELITLNMTVQNVGSATAPQVSSTLSSTDPFISITDDSESYGDVISNGSVIHSDAFAFSVADNVPDQHVAYFSTATQDNGGNSWSSNFQVLINAPSFAVTGYTIDDSNGNNDGHLDPGESVTIHIFNSNNGHADALNTSGVLTSSSPYVSVSNPNFSFGSFAAMSSGEALYTVTVDAGAPYGATVPFSYSIMAGSYAGSFDFTTVITPAIEDFETGDFTKYDWQLSGDANWQSEVYDVFEGEYSARSGDIGNNQSSTLMISLSAVSDDSISFMMSVSSEGNYDSLSFRIDNVSMGHWSGEVGWTSKTYAVSAGLHTFTWEYKKDNAVTMGYDCGYLDNILLPTFEVNQGTSVASLNGKGKVSAYPNPFSSLTFIDYSLSSPASVTVQIFDVTGKLIQTILNNNALDSGNYHMGFDGSALPDGNYICRMTVNGKITSEKLIHSK